MTIRWEPKLAGEVRDYTHDWSLFLGADTITTSTVTVSGVTKDSDTILAGNKSIRVWLSAGTAGAVASITNTIVTAGGRTETETFTLPIVEYDEPVSLAEAKSQCRVLDDSEDAYIASLIPAARRFVENRSGVILKRREFTERHLPTYGAISLYNGPIASIGSVAYLDSAGAAATYTGARFFVGSSMVFPAADESWPSLSAGESFTITYTAGLTPEQLATDEHASLVHAVKLLIGTWFNSREGVSRDATNEVPFAIAALCDQYRAVL